MGIRGARSMMDADPARYSETFTWNLELKQRGQQQGSNHSLGLLVDGKSLMYHVLFKEEKVVYASPATIHESCGTYLYKLLQVVGDKGGVHIFLDGVPPETKVPSQIARMSEQALNGDKLARGDMSGAPKLLHHLAEWAFVEAVQVLYRSFGDRVQLHRPSSGEAEAHINQWIVQNPKKYSKIGIISEDSDFLVYESCPGFMPPSSIRFEEREGRLCFQAKNFLRSKFQKTFLEHPTKDTTVMTTIAALAGCDYAGNLEQSNLLDSLRKRIVASDLGGLRAKLRKNANAAASLRAILRVVAYYKVKKDPEDWLESLCKDFAGPKMKMANSVIKATHGIYYYSLELSSQEIVDIMPGMVEVRRLLQHGLVYCYPVMETFKSINDVDDHVDMSLLKKDPGTVRHHFKPGGVYAHALIPSPPISSQIELWIARSPIWQFPHFRQIRTRLYCYLRLMICNGRVPARIIPGDFWISSDELAIEEVVRISGGKKSRVERTRLLLPDHSLVSGMIETDRLLLSDNLAIDRGILFCILGTQNQLGTFQKAGAQEYGVIFVASTMLPFNMACLLLLMSTAPAQMSGIDLPNMNFDSVACTEAREMLPVLSVACAHASLVVNSVVSLWEEKIHLSSLALPEINASGTFRHDIALMIWQNLREGRNLEYLRSQDSITAENKGNVAAYLEGCFTKLKLLRPNDQGWSEMLAKWHLAVAPVYDVWWDASNLDEVGELGSPKIK